jgi:hypothetical protein
MPWGLKFNAHTKKSTVKADAGINAVENQRQLSQLVGWLG